MTDHIPYFSVKEFIRNNTPQPCCDAAKELADFKRRVSDALIDPYEALKKSSDGNVNWIANRIHSFIQPEPVKVDPLVEAVKACGYCTLDAIEDSFAADLRAELAKRNLTITEGEAK